jgi:uncharacterized protein
LGIGASWFAAGAVRAIAYQTQRTKYSQVETRDGITGADVARRLLDAQGLQGVAIESTPGILSDHYDPHSKTLRLSQQVYFTPSVAAAGIAAHEAGHALQDAEDYFPMEALTYIVPIVQIASQVAPWHLSSVCSCSLKP